MSNKPEVISIDGVNYTRQDLATLGTIGSKRIIVADRGWVFAGDCVDNEDGSVTISNAMNIRVWGTSAGLGELVNGPLSGTKADKYGTVRCTPIVQINILKGW